MLMLHKGTESKQPSKTNTGWEMGMQGTAQNRNSSAKGNNKDFSSGAFNHALDFRATMLLVATMISQYRH